MKKIILSLVAFVSLVFADTDYNFATELEKKCTSIGTTNECYGAGFIYHYGAEGVKLNYDKALKFFKKACEAKEDSKEKFSSCFQLGLMYENGRGTKQNYKKAMELYTKACNEYKNDGDCFGLAYAYEYGIGVKQDKVKAAAVYRKICDADNVFSACYNFALYNENYGDKQKAMIYYKKTCDIGRYDYGVQNHSEAKEFWQRACNMYEILK